jgi:hypothetical protein
MKIYKGDVSIDLGLKDFLELLEEDALDEIIDLVVDLEQTGSISPNNTGFEAGMYMIDVTDYDGNIEDLFDKFAQNPEAYEITSEEDLSNLFGVESMLGQSFASDEDIMDNFLLTNEDLKVKRILKRFGHVNDAS